jgi:hypothetical protein
MEFVTKPEGVPCTMSALYVAQRQATVRSSLAGATSLGLTPAFTFTPLFASALYTVQPAELFPGFFIRRLDRSLG